MAYESAPIVWHIEEALRQIAARQQILARAANEAFTLKGVLDSLESDLKAFTQAISREPRTSTDAQFKPAFNVHLSPLPREAAPEGRPVHSISNEEEGIVDTYNEAPKALHSRYQLQPFGVVNGNEIQRNADAAPIFGDTERGAYLLIPSTAVKSYVIPKDDILFQDAYYNNEAMGMVFECVGYQAGMRYRHIELVRPAVFSNSGGRWIIERKGEIQLSAPDLT